jgi:hypothetical protein
MINSSLATVRVSCEEKPNLSDNFSASIIREMIVDVPKTLGFFPEVTRFFARENFVAQNLLLLLLF